MKRKILLFMVAIATSLPFSAQQNNYGVYLYPDERNPELLHHVMRKEPLRTEFIIPPVNGYNVYKSDLHTHTIYSDGSVTPEYRIREAWYDGLDVVACTDHMEHRPWESLMLQYLNGHVAPETKASEGTDPKVDFNFINELAVKEGEKYGITVIPGAEVTRNQYTVGHYNVLFVEDVNAIFDKDPLESIRKARKAGAVIMHNHPGWLRNNNDMIEFEKKVYAEKLIDGVEVMNEREFYPNLITRAAELKLFVASNTDVHATTATEIGLGQMRDMTLIFAKDKSLPTLKEALLKRRTLAYAYEQIAGDEQLLKDLFEACVEFDLISVDSKGERKMLMRNISSLPFYLKFGNSKPQELRALSSRIVTTDSKGKLSVEVINMWAPEEQHPIIVFDFKSR